MTPGVRQYVIRFAASDSSAVPWTVLRPGLCMQKRKCWLYLILCLFPGLVAAAEIATPGGTIAVSLPADFTPLSAAEMKIKFGRNGALPVAAYGNAKRSGTVAVSWSPLGETTLTPDQLPQLMDSFRDAMSQQVPGLHWISSEVRIINGKRWIFMENIAPGRDTPVHDDMYLTDLKGNLLAINFNITEAEHAAFATEFKSIEKSLKVK